MIDLQYLYIYKFTIVNIENICEINNNDVKKENNIVKS